MPDITELKLSLWRNPGSGHALWTDANVRPTVRILNDIFGSIEPPGFDALSSPTTVAKQVTHAADWIQYGVAQSGQNVLDIIWQGLCVGTDAGPHYKLFGNNADNLDSNEPDNGTFYTANGVEQHGTWHLGFLSDLADELVVRGIEINAHRHILDVEGRPNQDRLVWPDESWFPVAQADDRYSDEPIYGGKTLQELYVAAGSPSYNTGFTQWSTAENQTFVKTFAMPTLYKKLASDIVTVTSGFDTYFPGGKLSNFDTVPRKAGTTYPDRFEKDWLQWTYPGTFDLDEAAIVIYPQQGNDGQASVRTFMEERLTAAVTDTALNNVKVTPWVMAPGNGENGYTMSVADFVHIIEFGFNLGITDWFVFNDSPAAGDDILTALNTIRSDLAPTVATFPSGPDPTAGVEFLPLPVDTPEPVDDGDATAQVEFLPLPEPQAGDDLADVDFLPLPEPQLADLDSSDEAGLPEAKRVEQASIAAIEMASAPRNDLIWLD